MITLDGREVMATSRQLACPFGDRWMVYVPGGGNMGAQYKCPGCKLQVRIPWVGLHRSMTAKRPSKGQGRKR
jgi:hypothetical protein